MMKYSYETRHVKHFIAVIKEDNIASLNLFEKRLSFKETSYSSFFREKTLEVTVNEKYFMNFGLWNLSRIF